MREIIDCDPYGLRDIDFLPHWYLPECSELYVIVQHPDIIVRAKRPGAFNPIVGIAVMSEDTDIEAAKEWLLLMTQAVCYGKR